MPMALRAKSNWGQAGRSSWVSLAETPKLPSASRPFASCISGSFQWWLRALSHLLARDTCEKPLSLTACRPLSSSVQVREGCGLPSLYFLHSPDPVTAPPQPHMFITLFRDFQNPVGSRWPSPGTAFLHLGSVRMAGSDSQSPLFSPPWYLSPSATLPTPFLTTVNPSANKCLLPGFPDTAGWSWGWGWPWLGPYWLFCPLLEAPRETLRDSTPWGPRDQASSRQNNILKAPFVSSSSTQLSGSFSHSPNQLGLWLLC